MATHAIVDEVRLRRFARLAAPLLRSTAQQGFGLQVAQNKAGTGLEFLDLRPYATGEDARHIDWRQSQLRNQMLMRSYREETASDWTICLDGSASGASGILLRSPANCRIILRPPMAVARCQACVHHCCMAARMYFC